MRHTPMEQMRVFREVVSLADEVWRSVASWKPFERDTIGKQLVRAMDSIGANLVEGDGRYAPADALRFFVIARGSARESRYWLERAKERGLIIEDQWLVWLERLTKATIRLNHLIAYRRSDHSPDKVKEKTDLYGPCDPFLLPLPSIL